MISFGNAASSHSGLIPLKTSYKKRGELLWAIVSKKNFINLHSSALVTVFARNLVHAYKFRISQVSRRTTSTAKKCTKTRNARAKMVVLLIRALDFFPSFLQSPFGIV